MLVVLTYQVGKIYSPWENTYRSVCEGASGENRLRKNHREFRWLHIPAWSSGQNKKGKAS